MSLDSTRQFGTRVSPPLRRSVRLAAVFALVLLGMAFVGSAPVAADGPTIDDVTIEDDVSWIGIEDDHTVTVRASDIDTTDGPATVTLDLSGWNAESIDGAPAVEIRTDGVEIVGDVETDGTETTFDVDDTSETVIDLDADIEVSLDHPTDSSFDGATYEASLEVADSTGSTLETTEVTVKRLSYEVQGEERFPPSTEFVYRNQTVTVHNLESGANYNLYEFDPESDALGDPIEAITPSETTASIDTSDHSIGTEWYIVYDGNDIVLEDQNAFQVRTHELEAAQADQTVDTVGDGARTSVTIDSPLRSTPFDVNVTSEAAAGDELFDVFDGETNDDVERSDAESTIVIRDVEAGDEIPMTFDPVLEATYDFQYEARDTRASDATTVRVEERERNAGFGSETVETAAGEIVEISVSLDDADEAYVMIGGDKTGDSRTLTNYFDVLHVRGSSTIRINTRLLGTNVPSDEVYATESGHVTSYLHDPDHEGFDDVTFEGDADDLTSFRAQIGVSTLPRPLQPVRLRLVAGASGDIVVRDDGVPDFERPLARSNLVITDTDGFGNVTTYVAPKGSANEFEGAAGLGDLRGSLTERRTVAKGDRLVFEIEARGITGLVTWLDERLGSDDVEIDRRTLSKLLEFPDGVVLDAEKTNVGRNESPTVLDIEGATDGELYLVHEPTFQTGSQRSIDRFFLVIDTRGTGPFDREMKAGDEYRFDFGYASTGETDWFETVDHDALDPNGAPPHFPYHDADAGNDTESRHVTIEPRTVEFDRLDSRDRPVVRGSSSGTLSGETNLAPGTETTIQLVATERAQPTQITLDEVEIGPNGTFEVTRDFSGLDPGESLEVEFYVEQRLFEKRAAVVAPEGEDLTEYAISEYTESATVQAGDDDTIVVATIENAGYLPDRQSVELRIDDEQVTNRTVELDEGETTTIEFGGRTDLDPGSYAYTITADDFEAAGRLLVEERSAADENANEGYEGANAAANDDAVETDGGEMDQQSDGEIPEESPGPFGVLPAPLIGSRSAIGGAAIVGAIHVLGHWT